MMLLKVLNQLLQPSFSIKVPFFPCIPLKIQSFYKKLVIHLWVQVLLGRASADVKVDIDLGRESRHNKISRRQVCSAWTPAVLIKMGSFSYSIDSITLS